MVEYSIFKVQMEKRKKLNIIDAAQELFGRFGFIKTTVDDIAKAARMGKATIYHYFKGKEYIYKEVVEKESNILNEKINEAIKKEISPQKKLKAFVLTRMQYLNELTNLYSALKDEFLKGYDFIEKIREMDFNREIEIVKEILKEGIEKKIFSIRDLKLTAFVILAALKGLEYPWSEKVPVPELERNVEKLLEILFKGILRR
ncbi:MAG TPA: TetR/AcrR family transcriptional regulator [Candidatus Atribacteria bacterium]|nr:TetR/AcrR family transcriptional regulator [Candidatus Atribacteria bacterium]